VLSRSMRWACGVVVRVVGVSAAKRAAQSSCAAAAALHRRLQREPRHQTQARHDTWGCQHHRLQGRGQCSCLSVDSVHDPTICTLRHGEQVHTKLHAATATQRRCSTSPLNPSTKKYTTSGSALQRVPPVMVGIRMPGCFIRGPAVCLWTCSRPAAALRPTLRRYVSETLTGVVAGEHHAVVHGAGFGVSWTRALGDSLCACCFRIVQSANVAMFVLPASE
jgi:hypothetical protein